MFNEHKVSLRHGLLLCSGAARFLRFFLYEKKKPSKMSVITRRKTLWSAVGNSKEITHFAKCLLCVCPCLVSLDIHLFKAHCPGKYYWGYRTDSHADITMPRQILLRVQNWWSRRYHTAQANIIEGTELMVTQISHCPGRYYWGYRTYGHTDITLPRQGTELIAIQISHCSVRYLPFIWLKFSYVVPIEYV